MIAFDKYGNLIPYDIVETNLQLFEKYFVNEMRYKNHRHQIFTNYINYTQQLNKLISNEYFQWINGSYVTKTLKPNDIDLVSFIDYRIVENNHHELTSYIYPFSKNTFNVDAYIVKTYPIGHPYYKLYQSDNLYWLHQFLKTRPTKYGKQMNKGFIKIDMRNEKL